jgi:hypothetical protein
MKSMLAAAVVMSAIGFAAFPGISRRRHSEGAGRGGREPLLARPR